MTANILNIFDQTIQYGSITLDQGRIARIDLVGPEQPGQPYIMPGFVDAHVHIESSLLTPPQFARLAVVHGTVATVSDPHEIGNVLGVAGVEYMLNEAKRVPFKFMFGAPSCVPATTFETAGARIDVEEVRHLLSLPDIGYLAEMMNYPGVLQQDADVLAKIALAKSAGKPVDGHAPGLTGTDAQQYIDAGISTDHECFTYEEGLDKARRGMHILIREGSAARNFDALIPLLNEFPAQIMFCSDDKHPDTLALGHINQLVIRAIEAGCPRWSVLRAACLNPVLHYRMPVGLLQEGDLADFIVVDDLIDFRVRQTVINGEVVAEAGESLIADLRSEHVNNFTCSPKEVADFAVPAPTDNPRIRVIEALDGQLITNQLHFDATVVDGQIVADPARDVLKLVVVNRYQDVPPAVAFVKNFGLQRGAMASSVAHDSHNIIAVGCNDASICNAINQIIDAKGGLSAVNTAEPHEHDDERMSRRQFLHITTTPDNQLLRLPVAGLMSDTDGYDVAAQYAALDRFVKQDLGSTLSAPFMTLSFMGLLVIPTLKLSDMGLFDGKLFNFNPTVLN